MERENVGDRGHSVMIRGAFAGALAAALVGLAAPAAHAGSLSCERVEADFFEIDGMLDDWSGVRARRAGGNRAQGSFDLRCAFDDERLYLAVDVRDDVMLRTAGAKPSSEDNLAFDLRIGKQGTPLVVRAFPAGSRQKPVRRLGRGKLPRWIAIEDSGRPRGFAVELALPLARIPGYGRGTPALTARVAFVDGDVYGKKAGAGATFAGRLHLAGGGGLAGKFLAAAGLTWKDIKLDRIANVDDDKGAERVMWGGAVIGVITDRFNYFSLPVKSGADVARVRLVDFEGKGRHYLVAEFRQYGNGGSRDVVGVWRYTGVTFVRMLGFEVGKSLGANSLSNRWSLVPRGKHRPGKKRRFKGGVDILVEAGKAVGWDEDDYPLQPATDVRPILLPWDDQTTAVYWIEGGVIGGGDPARR